MRSLAIARAGAAGLRRWRGVGGERAHSMVRTASDVELACFGGLTYEETAARPRLPIGTLESRFRSALLLLRNRIEERRS
jgi:hypothetical protein